VFVTGPDIVRSVTGEDVDMGVARGPGHPSQEVRGVPHRRRQRLDAYERGRRLVGLFCQQGHFDRSKAESGDTDLHAIAAGSARRAYDVHRSSRRYSTATHPSRAPGKVGSVDRPSASVGCRAEASAWIANNRCGSAAA